MNYYLLTHDHPPLIIYEEDKAAYYMALALFDLSRAFQKFIKDER